MTMPFRTNGNQFTIFIRIESKRRRLERLTLESLMKTLLFLAAFGCCVLVAARKGRVVCYFTNWSRYRKGPNRFRPNDIDPSLCTHINYAFASLDNTTWTLKPRSPETDITDKYYKKVTGLKSKNSNLKVLISLGGWSDSAGDKYSLLVQDPSKRREFLRDLIPFLKKYKFDGLDIDWEYPKCWQGECSAGPDSDKSNYVLWIKELRAAFNRQKPRILLTAAVANGGYLVQQGYDIAALGKYMDFINIMTYDFHSYVDGQTGHHAQWMKIPGDGPSDFNALDSLNEWLSGGAPKHKLVLGIPAYGKSFTLSNRSRSGLKAPTKGPGKAGFSTGEKGVLAYYEICARRKSGWKKGYDPKVGPWAFRGLQWVGYDDVRSAMVKSRYVRKKGFGGVMMWDISLDDFRGKCCNTKFPLLKALNFGLLKKGTNPRTFKCP